jgi:hypothetical protein
MIANKFFKIFLLPYLFSVLLAMSLGREQVKIVSGNNMFEEYLFFLICMLIYEAQIFVIEKIENR